MREERTLVPDVFDLAAGQVGRSETEIALRSGERCRVHTNVYAARKSACATGLASTFNWWGDGGRGRRRIGAVAAERLRC
jgi:hypothetical protein